MKKFVAIICALLCVLSLAACDGANDPSLEQTRKYVDEQKLQGVDEAFKLYLSALDYLSDSDREIPAGEELFNYNAFTLMSNQEVESFLPGVDGHGFKTALESFHLSRKTLGALEKAEDGSIRYEDYVKEQNGNQLLAKATVFCENGKADVELIFSNDLLMTLEGGSLNARASFSELMEKAGLNTLIGMGTVFAVLILISLIIACFGIIPKIQAAFAKKEEVTEAPAAPVEAPAPVVVEEEDDTELVAVIAAAIAAYEGSTNTDGFVVRSIRRR